MEGYGILEEVKLFAQGKDWRTLATYSSYGKKLERFLEENKLTLEKLKPIDVKKFIYASGTNEKGERVMNSMFSYKKFLSALLRFIGRNDLVEYIRLNMREVKAEAKFAVDLSLDEILRLIDVTDQLKFKFAWSLMAFDGLRSSEVLGLHYSDVDTVKKNIRLFRREGTRYYPKGMKVGQQPNIIPLNDFSLAIFRQLPFKRGERIVPISYKNMRKWFLRYVKITGVQKDYPVTPHKLRHFFGHFWLRQRGDIRNLQKVMRHSDIKYTLLYTEPTETEIKEEFEAVMSFENLVDKRTRQD